MYTDFVFLDRFLFELSCKDTHTHTHTNTHTHRDSNEYPIVAFSKNATITRKRFSEKTNSCVYKEHSIHTRLQYMTKPVWSHVLALSALSNHT